MKKNPNSERCYLLAKFCILTFKLNCHCLVLQKRELPHKVLVLAVLNLTKSPLKHLMDFFFYFFFLRLNPEISGDAFLVTQFIVC